MNPDDVVLQSYSNWEEDGLENRCSCKKRWEFKSLTRRYGVLLKLVKRTVC